ncbi:hypothetical protein [Mesorhizobium sp.]|uniref:hypothetical protein n=1 Tax=Mesorhizobium sp. TaxID=1871066 RepID=UPI000FE614E1|nr:hypothetical protein [Mesorhizobium sp.]RWQ62950.1 MAG: hypothetical protein EOS86_27255 [Mesorhizobium sp.]
MGYRRLADLLHLRLVADALLERRGESPPDDKEARHAMTIEADLPDEESERRLDPPRLGRLDVEATATALRRLAPMIARMLAAREADHDSTQQDHRRMAFLAA